MSARRTSTNQTSVLVGLIGAGIQASLTPAMHEREALVQGYSDAYRLIGNVLQLGAGGAGSAVAYALLTAGVQNLSIFDTDDVKARGLATAVQNRFDRAQVVSVASVDDAVGSADGLVNTTPVGMANLPGMPLQANFLRPSLWVADVICFPLETELLRKARLLGCRTMNGGGMAVFQAVEAFRLFTGRPADATRVQRHFTELCAMKA
jgi:shikimate dehydrogenase